MISAIWPQISIWNFSEDRDFLELLQHRLGRGKSSLSQLRKSTQSISPKRGTPQARLRVILDIARAFYYNIRLKVGMLHEHASHHRPGRHPMRRHLQLLPRNRLFSLRGSRLPRRTSKFEEHECDVVVSNVSIAGGTIHDLIHAVKRKDPKAEIIVDADVQTTQEAVQAVREGAFSILQKPFSIPELNFQIKRALERRGQKLPFRAPPDPTRMSISRTTSSVRARRSRRSSGSSTGWPGLIRA